MGPAYLDDVLERVLLVVQRIAQLLQRRDQGVRHLFRRRDVHGRRESVVGRLRAIDVVVRVNRVFRADRAAQHLDGAVGDNLIGVHVRLGAGPRLPDGKREVVVQLAFGDFQSGLGDGVGQFRLNIVEALIGQGRRALDDAQCADQRHRHGFRANREIDQGAGRLGAEEFIGRDFQGTKAVGFCAHLAHEGRLLAARLTLFDDGELRFGRVSLRHDGSRRMCAWPWWASAKLDRAREGSGRNDR